MVQALGIFGFLLSLLAIFIVGETVRRASARQLKSETDLFKANLRIQDLENRLTKVERMVIKAYDQKKRQADTLTSMAEKTEQEDVRRSREYDSGKRFTPSEYKSKKTG